MGDHMKLKAGVAPEVKVLNDQFQITKEILHSFGSLLSSQNNGGGGGLSLSGKIGRRKREEGSQTVIEGHHIDKQSWRIAELEHQLMISEWQKKKLELQNFNKDAEIWRLREEVEQLKEVKTSNIALDSVGTGTGGGEHSGRQEQRRNEEEEISVLSSSYSLKKGDGPSSSSEVEGQGQGQQLQERGSAAGAGDKSQDPKVIRAEGSNWNIPQTTVFSVKHNLIGCYPCKGCGLDFNSSTDLRSHLSSVEHKKKAPTKEAKYKCPKCNQSFITLVDTMLHNIFHHRDSRNNAAKK